jgi:Ribosomal protein S21
VLDIIDPKGPRSGKASTPSTIYGDGLTSRIGKEIDVTDRKNHQAALDAVHLRLTPMLGRTLAVEPGIGRDLQASLKALEVRNGLNKVKSDNMEQRHHVRRGQAKKVLASKRWRALFMKGFLREVARVVRMRRQGW